MKGVKGRSACRGKVMPFMCPRPSGLTAPVDCVGVNLGIAWEMTGRPDGGPRTPGRFKCMLRPGHILDPGEGKAPALQNRRRYSAPQERISSQHRSRRQHIVHHRKIMAIDEVVDLPNIDMGDPGDKRKRRPKTKEGHGGSNT